MHFGVPADLVAQTIQSYGLWAVFVIVMLESSGLPLPGETALLAAAMYAGATGHISIWEVIAAAAAGAILGDNIGYWVGRRFGFRLLLRYGRYIHLHQARLKVGLYLFGHHGGKIVFFGRFIALLRAYAALLAGANCMAWGRFFAFNALGGIAWTTLYGYAAYRFGEQIAHVTGPLGRIFLGLAVVGIVAAAVFFRHHEKAIEAKAEREFPGPLKAPED